MKDESDIKDQFEEIYSLSIRRGEDSSVVWQWVKQAMQEYANLQRNAALSEAIEKIEKNYKCLSDHGLSETVKVTKGDLIEILEGLKK